MVTTNHIIAGLVALLTNRRIVSRSRMIAFTESLKAAPHLSILHIDQPTGDEAWALVKLHTDKFWSLTDAASFVVMRRQGIFDAISTDQYFTQAESIRLPVLA
jgi:predicted nucleic acid-binding protein